MVIADIPRLGKGGVNAPRSKEAAKPPLKGAEGAVRSTSDYRRLERTAPSAPTNEPDHFIDARPPRFAKAGEKRGFQYLAHLALQLLVFEAQCREEKPI